MAAHVRTQIREAVGALLVGLPTTGANVFQSLVYPLAEADLPGLRIYSESESLQPLTVHTPRESSRLLRLRIVGIAKATTDLDDVLDQICKEVETALQAPVLEPLARSITLVGTEIELEGTADQPTGSATMTWEVEYFTAENAPDVAL